MIHLRLILSDYYDDDNVFSQYLYNVNNKKW